MHAKPDLRVVEEWMIADSGSVIAAVLALVVMRNFVILTVSFAALIYLVTGVFGGAHWVGQFELTVSLDAASNIDEESIVYVECWDEHIANYLCDWGADETSEGFEPPHEATQGTHRVYLPCSGRSGRFSDTYNHPGFVVVQYRTHDDDGQWTARKVIRVPTGRGPRSVSVVLP